MVQIPETEIERVRIQLRHQLQEDISNWMKARFWVAAIMIGALSFFGVRGVVQQVFEEDLNDARSMTRDIVVKAETAIALASDATGKAKTASEKVQSEIDLVRTEITATKEQLATYAKTLAEIEQRANTVGVTFQEIELRIGKVSAGTRKLTQGSFDTLLTRVEKIETTVADLATNVGYVTPSGESVASVQRRVVAESENRLFDIKQRSDFSVYLWIADADETRKNQIVKTIESLNFPIATSDQEIGSYPFSNLTYADKPEFQSIKEETLVVSVTENPTEETVAFATELLQALGKSTRMPTKFYKGETIPGGAIIAIKPTN